MSCQIRSDQVTSDCKIYNIVNLIMDWKFLDHFRTQSFNIIFFTFFEHSQKLSNEFVLLISTSWNVLCFISLKAHRSSKIVCVLLDNFAKSSIFQYPWPILCVPKHRRKLGSEFRFLIATFKRFWCLHFFKNLQHFSMIIKIVWLILWCFKNLSLKLIVSKTSLLVNFGIFFNYIIFFRNFYHVVFPELL